MGGNTNSGSNSGWQQVASKKRARKVQVDGDASVKPDIPARAKAAKEKLIAETKAGIVRNSTPNKKAGSAATSCTTEPQKHKYQPPENKKKENEKVVCNFSSLTVDKSGRNYILDVKPGKKKFIYKPLSIVAGYNKKAVDVTCNIAGLEGPCEKEHKGKVIDFLEASSSKSDSSLKFKAYSKYAFNFFPYKPATNSYWIAANTCGGKLGADLTVYPDTYWKVSIKTEIKDGALEDVVIEGEFKEDQNNLNFKGSYKDSSVEAAFSNDSRKMGMKTGEDEKNIYYQSDTKKIGFASTSDSVESNYENTETGTKSHASFSKEAVQLNDEPGKENAMGSDAIKDMSLDYGDIKWQIDHKIQSKINYLFKALKAIDFVKDIIDMIFRESESPVEFDINWPSIDISGEWQWKEIEGSPECGFEYEVKGGLHPLVGCFVDVDLLGSALMAIPGIGTLASKCLDFAEYMTGNKATVNMKLEGDVNVDIDISKKAADKKATIGDPSTQVDITFSLAAKLKVKEKKLIIGYGGGIEGSAKIVVGIHKPVVSDDYIYLPCDFQFTGITVEQITYIKPSSEITNVLPDAKADAELEEEKKELKKDWLQSKIHEFSIPLI